MNANEIDLNAWLDRAAKSASLFYLKQRQDNELIEHCARLNPEFVMRLVQKELDDTAWAWRSPRVLTRDNIMAMLDTVSAERTRAVADTLRKL